MSNNTEQGGGFGCLFLFVCGWIVYGGFLAGIKTIFFSISLQVIAALSGLIPIFGVVTYWIVSKRFVLPFFESNYGIYNTWLSNLLFFAGLVVAIGVNIFVTASIFSIFRKAT